MNPRPIEYLINKVKRSFYNNLKGTLIHENGVAIEFSSKFAKMFGYKKEELYGKNLIKLLILQKYHGVIAENIKRNYTFPYEVEGVKKDGSTFPITVEGETTPYGNKNFIRVAVFRNLT